VSEIDLQNYNLQNIQHQFPEICLFDIG